MKLKTHGKLHHLNHYETDHIHVDNYILGARCFMDYPNEGRVGIFVHKNLNFKNIDLNECSDDKDIKACAVKLSHTFYNVCLLSIYRAPTGNFIHCVSK